MTYDQRLIAATATSSSSKTASRALAVLDGVRSSGAQLRIDLHLHVGASEPAALVRLHASARAHHRQQYDQLRRAAAAWPNQHEREACERLRSRD
jgi:hypothetical protein